MNSLLDLIHNLWTALQNGQIPNLGYWSYPLLAVLVAVEGPIATLIGAAVAATGHLRMELVFVSAATGNLTADTLWYSVGYVSGLDWLASHGKWVGIRRRHLVRLRRSMHDHARKILLIAKLTAGLVIPSLIAAGLARVPWRRWFPPVAAAEMLWTGALVLIGYYATEAIKQVERGMEFVAIGASVILLLVVIWLARRALRKKGNSGLLFEDETDESDTESP